MFTHFIVRYL